MSIDFPNAPSDGDLFTVGYKTWKYVTADGKWISAGGPMGPTGPTGPIGPTGPEGTNANVDDSNSLLANQIFR